MKVFLSSTYSDLIPEREAVEKVIVAIGENFVGMEYFFSREETPLATCLAEVAQSHWLVLVVGQRYGTTDPNGISYTEREYLRAGELRIPRFAFLREELPSPPSRLPAGERGAMRDDDPAKQESLKRFRSDLMARHTVSFFKTADQLATLVALTLARELLKQLPTKHALMPPPPENFVGREAELNELTTRLRKNGAVGIAGVRGMGGIGKSALASVFAYAHLPEYPAGVLWVPLCSS